MHIVQSAFTCTHELGQIREESLHSNSDVSFDRLYAIDTYMHHTT